MSSSHEKQTVFTRVGRAWGLAGPGEWGGRARLHVRPHDPTVLRGPRSSGPGGGMGLVEAASGGRCQVTGENAHIYSWHMGVHTPQCHA